MNSAKNLFLNAKILVKSTREEKAALLFNEKGESGEKQKEKDKMSLKCISFKNKEIPYKKLN